MCTITYVVVVLGGNDNGVHADGDHLAVLLAVQHGDLSLAVRAHPLQDTLLAHLGEAGTDLGGQQMGQRHQLLGLGGRIAEHVTLVTSTNLLNGLVDVHTLSNIGALLLNGDHDIASGVVDTWGGHKRY